MDDSYLKYPKRGYGQDHDFYKWRQAKDRPHLKWDKGAKLAVNLIIPLEFFPLNPSGVPFKHPGAMVTPYPDLRHFTVRDYGNRVGVYRILEALGNADLKATFAANGEIVERYPPLIEAVKGNGHEIAAHGISTDHIHHERLRTQDEASLFNSLQKQFGVGSGWLSPARNQSQRSLYWMTKHGFDYCLDWELENAPVMSKNKAGEITLLPNNYELSDFTLLHTRRQTEESWLSQVTEACEYLISEHERFGAQSVGLTLTPYIIGQPFRIWALREFLSYLSGHEDIAVMTGSETTKQFRDQIK